MVNDSIVPLEDAQISAHDRGFYFGDGVYETIACCRERLFAKEPHFERLENSLRMMDMLDKVDINLIKQRVDRAVKEAQIDEGVVYFHITRGSSLRSHDYKDDWQPNFFLTVRARNKHSLETIRAITHPDWRWKRCDIKSLNLLANILARHAAAKAGAYEAILVDEDSLVTEGTSTSVFLVKDDVLKTAPLSANILPSVTRDLMLGWAREMGLKVQERSFTVAEAINADELLIAGTITQVAGITVLDDKTIGNGKLGPHTTELRSRLSQEIAAI